MASDIPSRDPRSKLHSLVRLSGPFLGADLPPAERRAQVLSRMPLAAPAQRRLVLDQTEHGAMLVQVGPPASSKTAMPNHVLPVIPGHRNELVECHSEATRGRSPVTPDRPTKIVLRRSVESALAAAIRMMDQACPRAPPLDCHDMMSAAMVSSARMRSRMAQPTTSRVNRSRISAR